MKSLLFALLLVSPALSQAGDYEFRVHRFCDLLLHLDESKGHVKIEAYPKAVETTQTLFQSSLTRLDPATYETPEGIRFTLTRLSEPVVLDHNRHINSGDWRLEITGSSQDYEKLKELLIPISSFRTPKDEAPGPTNPKVPDMTYYGEERTP